MKAVMLWVVHLTCIIVPLFVKRNVTIFYELVLGL